jgi:DNA-binding NtrC family response regulator
VRYFLDRHSSQLEIVPPPIQKEAVEFLRTQSWPGNVRELESTVRRALLISPGFPITLTEVERSIVPSVFATKTNQSIAALAKESLARAAQGEPIKVYPELLAHFESELLTQAIALAGGNQVRAARWLGLSRFTLRERLRRFGLGTTVKS